MKVRVNGVSINYEVAGTAGRWVTLSHSLASNLHMWDEQIGPLTKEFRVLAVDTRGHGKSEAPEGSYSMEELAADIAALHDHLGIDRSHFVGLSLGGAIAQTFALHYPSRLLSLTIADATSAYPPSTHAMWQDRADAVVKGGTKAIATGTIERWLTEAFRTANPGRVASLRDSIVATARPGFIGAVKAIMNFDIASRLGEIHTPTLVVVGAEDRALAPLHSEKIAAGISGAQFAVIENAAHLSNVEQPEQFAAVLLPFLRKTSK